MEEAIMDVVILQLCGHQWQTEVTIDKPQRERAQALDSIEATLTSSDPKLASLLAICPARLRRGDAGAREDSDTPAATSNTRPATQTAMLTPR